MIYCPLAQPPPARFFLLSLYLAPTLLCSRGMTEPGPSFYKKGLHMTETIPIQAIHHVRFTVTDVARSQAFYTQVLGFQVAREIPTGVLLRNGSIVLGLGPAFDQTLAPADDRFNENRVGLDHFAFGVSSRADLEAAIRLFDAQGVPHGEIKNIGVAYVLAFRDPDNIQLELGAPPD